MTKPYPAFRFTISGCWSDAELLCILAADGLDALANRVRRLGGWCYSRAVDAHDRRREGRA